MSESIQSDPTTRSGNTGASDRELLELAAKAAGDPIRWAADLRGYVFDVDYGYSPRVMWRPLTDDGDALRLAVKLSIDLEFQCPGVEAYRSHNHPSYEGGGVFCASEEDADEAAATRRAIVRAAAAIGRAM